VIVTEPEPGARLEVGAELELKGLTRSQPTRNVTMNKRERLLNIPLLKPESRFITAPVKVAISLYPSL
jgi:hypothetical protein